MPVALRATCAITLAAILTVAGCGAPIPSRPAKSTGVAPSMRVDPRTLAAEPRVVSASEALADLDLVLAIFADAYAAPEGRSPLPPESRVEEARQAILARAAWSPRDLAETFFALFRVADGHLSFGYGGARPLRLWALPAPSRPRRAGSPVELIEGEVPVLAIRTFESAAAPSLRELPRMAERLRRARAFVIDLRGNHGGNYAFAERFLLGLTDRALYALDTREVLSVAACEGRVNAMRATLWSGAVPREAIPAFEEQISVLSNRAAELRERRVEIVRRGEVLVGRAPGPLMGRGVVLVDRGCASACEMLLALARQIPELIIAGERTRGGMAVGEVATFRLPRSGITVTLGTRAVTDPLGDFDETRGFSPDLPLLLDEPLALAEAQRTAQDAPLSAWAVARGRAPRALGHDEGDQVAKAGSKPVLVR